MQAEVLQRRGGQAGGVALRAQHHPFHVVADGLRQSRVAGRVAAPLQHVAFDDQRGGHLALAARWAAGRMSTSTAPRWPARRAPRARAAGAAGRGPLENRVDAAGHHSPLRFIGEFGALAAQRVALGDLVVRHRGQRRRVRVHAQRRRAGSAHRCHDRHGLGRPHDVVHPAEREAGLIAGLEPAAPQWSRPNEFASEPDTTVSAPERAAVVVQFGRAVRHPADQPDVELVVAVQAGEPALVGRRSAGRQQMVVAPPRARRRRSGRWRAAGRAAAAGSARIPRARQTATRRAVRKPCGAPE